MSYHSNASTDSLGPLSACITRMQDQLERMAQMQNESTMTISKLTSVVLQLAQDVNNLKVHNSRMERTIRDNQLMGNFTDWNDIFSGNPLLSPPVEPETLICDPKDVLGPLIPRKWRILVVEDDSAYQWIVSKHLESRGIECLVATTAKEAMAIVKHDHLDLILMDINLPGGLDGLEATHHIRLFDSSTPIVSMTSSITPRQIASYLAGGMNDVLPKPFSRDGLFSLVSRFCELQMDNESKKLINGCEKDGSIGVGGSSPKTQSKTTYIFNPIL